MFKTTKAATFSAASCLSHAREGNRINALWCEWREAVPEPDADAEFIVWLIEAKGWTEAEANNEHTVEI